VEISVSYLYFFETLQILGATMFFRGHKMPIGFEFQNDKLYTWNRTLIPKRVYDCTRKKKSIININYVFSQPMYPFSASKRYFLHNLSWPGSRTRQKSFFVFFERYRIICTLFFVDVHLSTYLFIFLIVLNTG